MQEPIVYMRPYVEYADMPRALAYTGVLVCLLPTAACEGVGEGLCHRDSVA